MHIDVDENGSFDGARLIDGRGYRSLEDIESFLHKGDRLALIVRKAGHFVLQRLHKTQPAWSSQPFWDDLVPSSVVASVAEGERLATEFLQ